MATNEDIRNASRLVEKGLSWGASPQRDSEYQSLVNRFREDLDFREVVHAVARGLKLEVLDVTATGAVVAPSDPDSLFAQRMAEFRASLGRDTQNTNRAVFVVIQVAVASAFYPTADAIDDADITPPSASATEVRERVTELCHRLKKLADEDPESLPMDLRPTWRYLLELPATMPQSDRASPSSLQGLVQIVLNHLENQKLLLQQERRGGEEGFYVPTDRYRILLARSTGTLLRTLHEIATEQEAA